MDFEFSDPQAAQKELLELILTYGFTREIPIHPDFLYTGDYRAVYLACKTIHESGETPSNGKVRDHLRKSGQSALIGSILTDLIGVPLRPITEAPSLLARLKDWHSEQQFSARIKDFQKGKLTREEFMRLEAANSQRENETLDRLVARLGAGIITAEEFLELQIPERPKLIGDWCRAADLGFVFAARGVGKTWLSMMIGNAIATGTALGEWESGEARPVCYVDGEMNLPDAQDRMRLLGITSPNFRLLHHELLHNNDGLTLDLVSPLTQKAIQGLLEPGSVLILDNLSALCRGMDENDNNEWEKMLGWLMELRRAGITVLVVHHAGKNGLMRGASRRDDAAHWIIKVLQEPPPDRCQAMVTRFEKCRNCGSDKVPPLRWVLDFTGATIEVSCENHSTGNALLELIQQGVSSATELAEELGVTKGTVSKWAKKLIKSGQIKKVGRDYQPA